MCIFLFNAHYTLRRKWLTSPVLPLLRLGTMDASGSVPNNLDDYSPSSTIITFDRPIPLLRGPLPADDDPSSGPFVLAFRDSRSWASAYRACESAIVRQCASGAMIGCAISASAKCKPPWWRAILGRQNVADLKEREMCEERETESCFAMAKDKCFGFAKDKCLGAFRDARIAVKGGRRLNLREGVKLICWASMADRVFLTRFVGFNKMGVLGVTNYRASELVETDDDVKRILGTCDSKASKI